MISTETPINKGLRYTKGIITAIASLAFCFWAGWGWLFLPLLVIDYYFFGFIKWSWGRNHPNKLVRSIITILGDILYVTIAVTFLFTFFFQNFAIPTSSLEKTLLTGDYLFVTKHKYGPRLPMTPLSLPFIHNNLAGSETYSDAIQLDYRRLAGMGQVERNDLVVFNFPAGDTVALSVPNPDYLTLCALYGRDRVHNDRSTFGEIVYRPIDKRDHYVKRCVGLPGETLEIRDAQVYIDGAPSTNPSKLQFNYLVQTSQGLSKHILDELEINYRDVIAHTNLSTEMLTKVGLDAINGQIYEMPLTNEMVIQLKAQPWVHGVIRMPHVGDSMLYPISLDNGWSLDNYGPLIIPKQGMSIELTSENYKLYERCIRAYEGHQLEYRNGQVWIDGKPTMHYTFEQNYYWMMGDNRHNSADSRMWGFVPEDHIVGQPAFIWLSLNNEQGWLNGRIRFSRMMRMINYL